MIVVCTLAQGGLEEMRRLASVPVSNARTDLYHPCQVLADCLTLIEHKGKLAGLKIAFVGDGNNMVHSWMEAAEKIPFSFAAACPKGYEPNKQIVARVKKNGAHVTVTNSIKQALHDADAIYTDVWTSMGQEWGATKRLEAFKDYLVHRQTVEMAEEDDRVMNCV